MRVFGFLVLWILVAACLDEQDCLITTTNLVKVSFKDSKNAAREIVFDEITVSGLDKKYYVAATVASVQLPVTPAESEVTLTFSFENRVETLTVGYDIASEIISKDCGAFTNYINLGVNNTSFDSLRVVNNSLTINAAVNVEILVD